MQVQCCKAKTELFKESLLQMLVCLNRKCITLTAVLSTKESHLRELDLGYNNISDYGVGLLVDGLVDINCRLKSLRLQGCGVTSRSCEDLANGLLVTETLQELDLSRNEIGDEGLFQLSEGLKGAPLKMLKMYHCGLTALSCGPIGEALKSETSTLVELNLSNNKLKDAGFRAICEGCFDYTLIESKRVEPSEPQNLLEGLTHSLTRSLLDNTSYPSLSLPEVMIPHFLLLTFSVSRCGITEKGCVFLAKVLCTVSQLYNGWIGETNWYAVELRELDISMNLLRDGGVKEMSLGLKNPYSHLKTLNLSHCGLTDDCCSELASGFASIKSVISDLDLSSNDLRDKGMKKLLHRGVEGCLAGCVGLYGAVWAQKCPSRPPSVSFVMLLRINRATQ
uniref:Uncharacterized protein n=1 Tax=Amphiprion percula TaxID=161767 RepID=A0A3P8SYX7_AMPPE